MPIICYVSKYVQNDLHWTAKCHCMKQNVISSVDVAEHLSVEAMFSR